MKTSYQKMMSQGLWHNNPGLVQLLGLCPMLAVSTSAVNGLGLGLATLAVMVSGNVLVSLFRYQIPDDIRLPLFVIIIATLTTSVEIILKTWAYDLYLSLGIFIPLIVTNCAIIGRFESFASKNPPLAALIDGLAHGLGFCLVLLALGSLREMLGEGTLFAHAEQLFGHSASNWTVQLRADNQRFLLIVLPPGAFILAGFLVAGKQALDQGLHRKKTRISSMIKAQRII